MTVARAVGSRDRGDRAVGSGTSVVLRRADAHGLPRGDATTTGRGTLAETVGAADRVVWDDTNRWYPALLAAGGRVERAYDLRLSRAILRRSALTAGTPFATRPPGEWDALGAAPAGPDPTLPARPDALFELGGATPRGQVAPSDLDPLPELADQLAALAGATGPDAPGRLRLLVAGESAGALVAAEMHHAGLPWRADVHDEILAGVLGPRPRPGERPARMEELARTIRAAIDAPPTLNPDSHPDLLKALQYAGVGTRSLRKGDLERLDHPVVEPLLEYKRLQRLLTANGWTWLDTWVRDGRFRTEYVVGGVVTGRWSSSGGGALQLPRQVRRAVVADPGWKLVVADAAQLEPRVLAGLASDERMADAGRGVDLYAGIVASGAVASREHAKVGMLGAMYGGTTGDSALVLPRLARAFPDAIALVERAARAGERGESVTTRLGRSSPGPGEAWHAAQTGAYAAEGADGAEGADASARARAQTRAWGRFTRNFVVQGTAAEWALCWLASIRRRLWELGTGDVAGAAAEPLARRAHLVFFLHDEVVVHAPESLVDDVAAVVAAAAEEAGRLLFGDFPVDFPLSVAVVDDYAQAK
ncbi:bifunctional 3'-5' exonuclease/DNA polymerase [Cellulosimicrobium arenosum]|uniref:bifunctional 3'-5' exonuclease/DNA polymerase n=1 Tax=Cellulosimicrobium arenosum TaxID=2708133 RepID=UPI00189023E7|nr:bifunctional 3'-5' exonuclease/DNA polymerase [Cellulosimicrobium arenosum]